MASAKPGRQASRCSFSSAEIILAGAYPRESHNPNLHQTLQTHHSDPVDRDWIRRSITNQREEHVPHAFRAGHSGMQDFNQLVPVLRQLPHGEVESWLDLIDQVASGHRECLPCLAKVTAYRLLITQGIDALETRHEHYADLYAQILSKQAEGDQRDFMREVLDSMRSGKDHPHRNSYVSWWRGVAEKILCSGRHQLNKNGLGFAGKTFQLNQFHVQRNKRVLENLAKVSRKVPKADAYRQYDAIKKNSNRG